MPWKITSLIGERVRLIRALLRGQKSVKQCAQEAQVRRTTAWKWRQRFWREGRRGLHDRSRRAHRMPRQTARVWVRRIERLRRRHADGGAKKLRAVLRQAWGRRALPCGRTMARWVERLGLVRRRRPRPRKAGRTLHPTLTTARRANQVWTADFKGWFRTGDGTRVEPLTVRDLFSRYGLAVQLLANPRWQPVQAVFRGLFRENGTPAVIRVEFTRPGPPEDNGAHEQFHRVLKRETLQPPARTRQGQQHRTSGGLQCYNQERPHEALGPRAPAKFYRKSGRRYPQPLPPVKYPADWPVRQVRSNGEIRWKGRRRFVGEAFVGQPVGLQRLRCGVWGVYFIPLLIGHLHDAEAGAMRPMVYRHRRRGHQKTKV